MVTMSFVDYSFEMHNIKEDHHPAVLEIQCDLKTSSVFTRKSKQYDRTKATDPASKEILADIIRRMPTIPWETSIDDHVAIVDDYCIRELQRAFPKPKRPIRQPYFDTGDLVMIDDKKTLTKSTKEAKEACKSWDLRIFFEAWRNTQAEEHFYMRHQAQLHLAMLQEQRDEVIGRFRAIRQQRRKNYLNKVVREFNESHGTKDPKRLYAAIRPLRPQSQKHRIKTPTPLPGMLNKEGVPLDSSDAIAAEWERVWGDLELAEPLKPDELCPPIQKFVNTDLAQCPSLLQLEGAFRRVRPHKAPGLDGVGPELFRANPAQSALRFFPLLLKEFATQQVPLRHQGGLAIAVHKKGPYFDSGNFRSILLEPILGKCLAKSWRGRLAEALDNVAFPMQHGARRGPGVLQNLHALRLRMRTCRAKGKTGVTLFLDLKSAFYATMRGLLLDQPMSEELIRHTFVTFGLPPTAYDDFCETISSSSMLREAGLPQEVTNMVSAIFRDSWFKVQNGKHVQKTRAGTRPGDPSADVLFALAMTKCIRSISKELQKALPFADVFTPLIYVDDVAIHASTDAPDALMTLGKIAQVVHDVMIRHGMRPNLGAGKTEGMVSYVGAGSRQLRRVLEGEEHPRLTFETLHSGRRELRLVRSYKYLGGMIEDNGTVSPEIRIRTLQAQGQLRPLRKTILANDSIDIEPRRTLVQALGISKATFGIGTWPGLNKTQRRCGKMEL